MKIIIPPELLVKLETYCATARGREVSGLGTIQYQDGDIHVTGVYFLAAGSEVFTEIDGARIAHLYTTGVDITKIKLWWHRHPVGNGIPGDHNWSSMDEQTIAQEPLGSSPELVKWSVSIVRTPYGWVGRIDDYRRKQTAHLAVEQPLTPEEHGIVMNIVPSPPALPQKQAKRALLAEAMGRLGISKGMPRHRTRYLTDCGLSWGDFHEMQRWLEVERALPEDVAAAYNVSVNDLRVLSLINWTEFDRARIRMLRRDRE